MIRTASELRHGTLRNKARRNQMRQRLMERDGTLCHWCDAEMVLPDGVTYPANQMTFDHVKPRSKGGSNHISNLVLACRRCNNGRQGKGTKRIRKSQVSKKAALPRQFPFKIRDV